MPTPAEIKFFRTLRDKKAREESGFFVAETPKVVSDMLAGGLRPEKIYVLHEAFGKWKQQYSGLPLESVSAKELERLSFLKQPHEVSALFSIPEQTEFEQQKTTIILDDISDPGNMGTIIRTAHWFGIQNIVCTENCVDIYNPKVVQSTMGSIARLNIYNRKPADILILFKKETHFYGAFMNGQNINETIFEFPAAIIIGSEAHGIQSLSSLVKHRISIPAANNNDCPESLNASVAAAIIMNYICCT
ncbi:MAG: RNA methyltransferase [Bacteroidetes bacterium HGW-Bacteroidetes-6]|jgi:TrmH family RNA methyltransferase|nr:MAG: RNA methyltransferase [Bacteroidetes bacterium HGW-Bacteroidetes-6]